MSVQLYRRTSVDFELPTSIDWSMLSALILLTICKRLQNTLLLRHLSVDSRSHPSDDLAAEAFVVAEMETSERLRLPQERDEIFDGRFDQATTLQVQMCEVCVVFDEVLKA